MTFEPGDPRRQLSEAADESMMRRTIATLLLIALLASCASFGQRRRLLRIEEQQAEHEVRLQRLKEDIAAAEERLAQARREADVQQCRATVSRIEAEVSANVAACTKEIAAFEACRAAREKSKGDGMLFGCGLGLIGALVTGGALGPWAVAGCGGGRIVGESSAPTCDERPYCESEATSWFPSTLASLGLSGMPLCGAGVSVELEQGKRSGALVTKVFEDGAAHAAGMLPGDVIVHIDSTPVRDSEAVTRALAGLPEGALVTLWIVRGSLLGVVRPVLRTTYDPSTRRSRVMLNITTESVSTVQYLFLRVLEVVPDGAGHRAGLMPRDVVLAIDGKVATSPAELSAITSGHDDLAWIVLRDGVVIDARRDGDDDLRSLIEGY